MGFWTIANTLHPRQGGGIRTTKHYATIVNRNAAFMPQLNGDINAYNVYAFDANVAREYYSPTLAVYLR